MKNRSFIIPLVGILICLTAMSIISFKALKRDTEIVCETSCETTEKATEETTTEETEIITEKANTYDIPLEKDTQDYIKNLCSDLNIPESLVIGIIEVESNFDEKAISSGGDYGLMQINKVNHNWLKEKYHVKDMLDPKDNVLCGASMIAELYHKYGEDLDYALMCYNCGEGRTKSLVNSGVETTEYCEKVKTAMEKYI